MDGKGSREESLTPKRLKERDTRGGGPPLLGTLEDMLKNASDTGISIGAPLQLRRTWIWRKVYIMGTLKDIRRRALANGVSLSEGLHEGDLEGGLFIGDPKRCVN